MLQSHVTAKPTPRNTHTHTQSINRKRSATQTTWMERDICRFLHERSVVDLWACEGFVCDRLKIISRISRSKIEILHCSVFSYPLDCPATDLHGYGTQNIYSVISIENDHSANAFIDCSRHFQERYRRDWNLGPLDLQLNAPLLSSPDPRKKIIKPPNVQN